MPLVGVLEGFVEAKSANNNLLRLSTMIMKTVSLEVARPLGRY